MDFELPSFLTKIPVQIMSSRSASDCPNDCSVFSCNNYSGPPGCPFDDACEQYIEGGNCGTYGEECETYSGQKTVGCYKQVYLDGTYSHEEIETGLTPGYSYTPEAHLPSYDAEIYDFVRCSPSGSITCPNANFEVYYYFEHKKVTCIKEIYYENNISGYDYEYNLWVGGTFTPDAEIHLPSYDSKRYKFSHSDPSGPMECPKQNFTVKYYFVRILVDCTQKIYYDETYIEEEVLKDLYAGEPFDPTAHMPAYDSNTYEFDRCEPDSFPQGAPQENFTVQYYFTEMGKVWIYAGQWQKAKPWVYTNGWKPAKAHIYANGWKP